MTVRRAAVGVLLLVLAGCATPGASSPGSTPGGPGPGSAPGGSGPGSTPGGSGPGSAPGGPPGPVTLLRTGGFAGVRDTLVVQPDGRWRRTGRTAGAGATGQLTAAQREQLSRLAADPRLAAEATRTPPPTTCRDAFSYAVTVAGTTVDYVDCPTDPDRPAAAVALVRLLTGATRW